MSTLKPGERRTLLIALVASILAAVLTRLHINPVLLFVVCGVALAMLAATVGQATEQLGGKLGPGATGVLQSALGNLPELFIGIFSLRAGLVTVVQAALVGSILGNSLLVLGLAFFVGGIKNGPQKFHKEQPRLLVTLMALAVAALVIPTLAENLHAPVSAHINSLSVASSVVLLLIFVASIPFFLKNPTAEPYSASQASANTNPPANDTMPAANDIIPAASNAPATDNSSAPDNAPAPPHHAWPMWLAVTLLTLAGVGSAFVSDWFVDAMQPAIKILHLSEAFTGLVLVAIAGNAVENVVGIQLAYKNQSDFAVSVILNSSLQVALALGPALVLLSLVVSPAHPLTLNLPPLLVVALGLTTVINTIIVYDGESNWLEGLALIGLYGILATSFWWG